MNEIFELQYALDTFYFLMCGALVMWMAAGFAMLEAGLVRSKNTTEILTKNIALICHAVSNRFQTRIDRFQTHWMILGIWV